MRYAANSLLKALPGNELVPLEPALDLESLVKCVVAIQSPRVKKELDVLILQEVRNFVLVCLCINCPVDNSLRIYAFGFLFCNIVGQLWQLSTIATPLLAGLPMGPPIMSSDFHRLLNLQLLHLDCLCRVAHQRRYELRLHSPLSSYYAGVWGDTPLSNEYCSIVESGDCRKYA